MSALQNTITHDEQLGETGLSLSSPPVFQAPGPGSWTMDPVHWPRPLTPWMAQVFPEPFSRGFAEGGRRYGLLFSHFEVAIVNHYLFMKAVPATEVASRFETCREALDGQFWRQDLDLWDRDIKPDSIRRNRNLLAVDPTALSNPDLAGHLRACFENHQEMVYRHHMFSIPALLPVGLFVAKAAAWTGLSHGELMELLRGSSPVSHGLAVSELAAVGRALKEEGVEPGKFPDDFSAACILDQLQGMPGPAGEATRAYLAACAHHSASGYDVSDLTAIEMPDMLIQAFWSSRENAGNLPGEDAENPEATARIRMAVPEEHRPEFDRLLAEARSINRLRDERGLFNDLWASGIARRAILEAGRRLALQGRLDDETLVFEATLQEMETLLLGGQGPTSDELIRRASRRLGVVLDQVPLFIGDPPAPSPPLEGFPPHVRETAAALGVALEEILGSGTGTNEPSVLKGKAVSPGIYIGRARLVTGPGDFNKLRRGDVLVTPSTNAAFNVVLPLIGAIVTDRGALLSHAAIVARECGIPAVVGTREATRLIPDGAQVRVDGGRGVVEVQR